MTYTKEDEKQIRLGFRASEIERSIINNAINYDHSKGVDIFIDFITSGEMNNDEHNELNNVIISALSAPYADRYKPLNALVCRAIEWKAERLAKLESE